MATPNSNVLGNNSGRFYSTLVKPVLIDFTFTVQSADSGGLGITNLKGSGVSDVFMYTSASAGRGPSGFLNPLTVNGQSTGYALIKLRNNYFKYCGAFGGFVAPATGGNLAINASALTVGKPFVISAVGVPSNGAVTIAPVADVSGSLASSYFVIYDAYGNTFAVWFSVSGVGTAPVLDSKVILVQQSIATNDTAGTIGTALAITLAALPSGIASVFSFTAAGTTTVTATSTKAGPLPGAPSEGTDPTGFTFANTIFKTNNQVWQAVGLPLGVNPAIGAAFVATALGSSTNGTSSGTVTAVGNSGNVTVEVVGDPNATMNPVPTNGGANTGGWVMLKFLQATSTSVTTLIPVAPANGSSVGFSFIVEQSSILISGE